MFRQSARQNRHLKHLKALEEADILRHKQRQLAAKGQEDTFETVVLRREARALQKAGTFAEFKSILMRNAQPDPMLQNFPSLSRGFAEVGGGAVFHAPVGARAVNGRPPEDMVRRISKRSLDSQPRPVGGEYGHGDQSDGYNDDDTEETDADERK